MVVKGKMAWEASRGLLLSSLMLFPQIDLKTGHSGRPTDVLMLLQDPLYSYRIRPREIGVIWKVVCGLGEVNGGINNVGEWLGFFREQNRVCEMVGFSQ